MIINLSNPCKHNIIFIRLFLALIISLVFVLAIYSQDNIENVKKLIKNKKFDEAQVVLSSFRNDIGEKDTAEYLSVNKLQAKIYFGKAEYKKYINQYKMLIEYLPDNHKKTGAFYFFMGKAFLRLEDYENYLKVNKKAVEHFEISYGKQSNVYITALNSLGFAYKLNGLYKNAEKAFIEAKKSKEKQSNYDLMYGKILNQLGNIYKVLNKFEESEECFKLSLKIKEKEKGRNIDYAKTIANYAILLQSIGHIDKAILKIDDAIAISTNAKKELLTLDFKQTKAVILQENDDFTKAAKLFKEIKYRKDSLKLNKGTNYSKILYSLGEIYYKLDSNDIALQYIESAGKLFKKLHGDKHPYYAEAIRLKADILLKKGEVDDIEKLYRTSSRIIARKYSKKHINYFKSEYAYFLFLKKTKNYSKAIEKIEKIDGIITEYIVDATKYLSIKEIIKVIDLYHDYYQEVLSLTSLNPDNNVLTAKAFDCSLFYKGYVLEALLSVKKAIRQSQIITELSEQLTSLRQQLKEEIDKEEKNSTKVTVIENEIDNVESDMARKLGKLRKEDSQMKWDVLQYELSDDEAAIDFVRFEDKTKGDHLYAALIILPDAEAPKFVSLFVESEVTKYFDGKLTESTELISRLYRHVNRGLVHEDDLEIISLYDLIWKPIAPHLNGISKVYYVCDGILHNIALHAIPTDMESVVSDSISLLQMTSFRNLIRKNIDIYNEKAKKALLIGGVKYGTIPDSISNRTKGKNWGSLPWTEKEVDQISSIMDKKGFDVKLLKGEKPDKNTLSHILKYAAGYDIMHFATHGYFNTDDLLKVKSKIKTHQTNLELNKSGLVFANANVLEPKDATLTAFELSELDLSKTKLVVLSACESGLGQVYESEGVYGMQRAFKIAGAEYIIMSLWQVPDRETKVFMTTFYKFYLEDNLSIEEAFYKTQRKMKENLLDPIRWAGFVLLK